MYQDQSIGFIYQGGIVAVYHEGRIYEIDYSQLEDDNQSRD